MCRTSTGTSSHAYDNVTNLESHIVAQRMSLSSYGPNDNTQNSESTVFQVSLTDPE